MLVFIVVVEMTDQSVSNRKRGLILDAARAVFSRKGYAEAAMEDVAEEARIAKGTLYLYFRSKEDLYLAALVSDLRAMSTEARKEMDAATDFREKLRAFLSVRLEYCRAREDFLRIYLAEYGSMFLKAPVSKELTRLLRSNMRHVARTVKQAQARNEIGRMPAGAVAAAIFDISRGLAERRLLGWKEFRPENEVEFAVDLLLSGSAAGRAGSKRKSAGQAQ